MGHYSDCYAAEDERKAKIMAQRRKDHPRDPSKWGISLEERVKLIEERLNRLERLGN